MKSKNFIEFVKSMENPVFTINDASRILMKKENYVKQYIHRLKNKGEIKEIERGKYALSDNPFSIASNIIFPSYISFLSGLAYYGITTQIPKTITVVSLKQKKEIKFNEYKIRFVKISKKRFFGYLKERYHEKSVFVAEPEKLLLDCIFLPQHCPITEVFEAVETLKKENRLDIPKLIEYCKKTGSSSVAKKIGYLLELSGKDIYPNIKELLNRKYNKLNPFLKKKGKKNKKWNLLINEDVV